MNNAASALIILGTAFIFHVVISNVKRLCRKYIKKKKRPEDS